MDLDWNIGEEIKKLNEVVAAGIVAFQDSGSYCSDVVGEWSAKEILAHLVFWHEVSVLGMESVASGGEPLKLDLSVDEANARAVIEYSQMSPSELLSDLRNLHQRFVDSARAIDAPNVVVVIRQDGFNGNIKQRFDITANHWYIHMRDVQVSRK